MISRGIILGKDADKLIVQATDDQVATFGVGDKVKVRPVVGPAAPWSSNANGHGTYYYDGGAAPLYSGGVTGAWPKPTSIADVKAALAADPHVYDRFGRRIGRVGGWMNETQILFTSSYADGPERIRFEAAWP